MTRYTTKNTYNNQKKIGFGKYIPSWLYPSGKFATKKNKLAMFKPYSSFSPNKRKFLSDLTL